MGSLSTRTAALLVVATMVGTGVFTTTGFLLHDVPNPRAVLFAWLLGGAAALFGALGYAELVAALPRNGGEYHLLSRVFHPALGFVSAWISLVVGFAAPIAASAIAFEQYAYAAVGGSWFPPKILAVAIIVFSGLVYGWAPRGAFRLQDGATLFKIVLILLFVGAGVLMGDPARLAVAGDLPFWSATFSPGFAVGLVFISYAYSGWNTACYIAGEVDNPPKNVPRALLAGTVVVTLLYLGLNAVFILGADLTSLQASEERVAHVAAVGLFGSSGARLVSGLIAIGLVSAVGALVATGPLVLHTVGEDYPRLRILTLRRAEGGPLVALALQGALAIAMVITSSFDALLTYIGLTLSLVAALTVSGVFVLRHREPDLPRPYRAWGHPITTLIFIALMAWMVFHTLLEAPQAALGSGATIAVGYVAYWLSSPRITTKT